MDRRTFIRLVAGSAACSFVGGAVPAGAEELDDNFTPFSPELAAEMASAFFEGAGGLSSCVCSERQSVVMLAINEGTASAPKRAGHAMAVSGYGMITRGLTSLNCIVVHDGWSDEAFINYDFQGFMDKNGVFM